MGKRGPAQKPVKVVVLHGNPGRRPLPDAEPEPSLVVGPLECPDWVPVECKEHFAKVVRDLGAINLLANVDVEAVVGMCLVYTRWMEAEKVVSEKGMTYESHIYDKTGEPVLSQIKTRPEVAIAQKFAALYRHYSGEFGMTPSARAGLGVVKNKKDDSRESIFPDEQTG